MMKAINITVAVLSFVLHLLIWQIAYSMAAEAPATPSEADKKYELIKKRLIDLGFEPPGETQNQPKPTRKKRVNTGVIGLVSRGMNGTYIQAAVNLASVLDGVEDLRILPIVGKGSVQNITDLLYLKGVDICIVQSDVLSYLRQKNIYRGLKPMVHYITKLYNEEVHLLVGKETETIQDLRGKKVNFGIDGSGTYLTASTVLSILEIEVDPTSFDQALAFEKLKQGEIAGMIYIDVKPARLFQDVKAENGIHFVPIPFTPALLDTYMASGLTAEDYPGLIPQGRNIRTVAVGAVLAAYNWSPDSPRYQNVARFVDAFFSHFTAFPKPSLHEKWTEVSLVAGVPGWTRFKAAADWLKQNQQTPEEELRTDFMQILSDALPETDPAPVSVEQKEVLSDALPETDPAP